MSGIKLLANTRVFDQLHKSNLCRLRRSVNIFSPYEVVVFSPLHLAEAAGLEECTRNTHWCVGAKKQTEALKSHERNLDSE